MGGQLPEKIDTDNGTIGRRPSETASPQTCRVAFTPPKFVQEKHPEEDN